MSYTRNDVALDMPTLSLATTILGLRRYRDDEDENQPAYRRKTVDVTGQPLADSTVLLRRLRYFERTWFKVRARTAVYPEPASRKPPPGGLVCSARLP